MMKKIMFSAVLASIFSVGCSKDDGPTKKCDSCTLQGQKIEICDNGNGTYTLSAAGETETLDEEDLGDSTPKEFVEAICSFDLGL